MMVTSKESSKALADTQSHSRSAVTNLNEKFLDVLTEREKLAR